jgi:hypothetical protein
MRFEKLQRPWDQACDGSVYEYENNSDECNRKMSGNVIVLMMKQTITKDYGNGK